MLSVGWTPYHGPLDSRNGSLYETTLVHSQWHSTSGPGHSVLFIGDAISPSTEERNAIDLFKRALSLDELDSSDGVCCGYTIGASSLA